MAMKAGHYLGMAALLALSLPVAPPASAQDAAREDSRTPELQSPTPDQSPIAPAESPAPDKDTAVDPTLRDATLPHADAPPVADTPPAEIPTPRPPAPDIAFTESQLFAILTDPGGTDSVTPTTAIPYVVGRSCYNWALKYAPVDGDLTLMEELILPGPARNWGTQGMKSEVNPQGSRAVTERHFDASTGTAEAGWCVAKDDPVGSYRYIIRQGEREVARFDFTVGDLL